MSQMPFSEQCYCPITDLDYADFAYEWMFEGKSDYTGMPFVGFEAGTLSAFCQALSKKMGKRYIEYFNHMNLTHPVTGEHLLLEAGKQGSGAAFLKEKLEQSAEKFIRKKLAAQETLPDYFWLNWNGEKAKITSLEDMETDYHKRLKLCPAFDDLDLIQAAVECAGAEMITLALRRVNTAGDGNILDYIPEGVTLLPNTSGARNAEEAVRIARLAREAGCGDFVKIEVIRDSKYLLPDNYETVKATEILASEGFVVMPYMYPDLNAARDLQNAGAAAIMPLASPIGSNKGLCTRDFIQILIDEIDLPIIVDAGIGRPSQACEAMEMGAAAIMANTAIATAGDIPAMAGAFRKAIEAGRSAYLAGMGRVLTKGASPSSPLTGFLAD